MLLTRQAATRGGGGSGPVAGDVLSLTVQGAGVIDASGYAPSIDGWVAGITFKGMGTRSATTDPVADPSSLVLSVRDQGYDQSGALVWVTRTVNGTLPLRNSYPDTWASIGLGGTVPPKSWCSTGTNNEFTYYTELGGLRGSTTPATTPRPAAPSGSFGAPLSDGVVSWVPFYSSTISGSDAGYVDAISGADVTVYFALDYPIYADTEILSAAIGAGVYTVGAQSSNANASIGTLVNNSTLAYEYPVVSVVTLPHRRATTAAPLTFQLQVEHAWAGVGGLPQSAPLVEFQAWDAARTVSTSLAAVTTPIAFGATNAAGLTYDVYEYTPDTTALGVGDCFVEYTVYSWLGTQTFASRYDAEGADRRDSTAYTDRQVVRNGANYYFVKSGTSGTTGVGTGPTGTTASTDYTDGSVTWWYFGNNDTVQGSSNPQARLHFYNDPSDLYKIGHAHVNDTNANIGSPAVYATEALSLASGASYGNIKLAGDALKIYHNTAGGGLTVHNDPGGGNIWLLAGTHLSVQASMTSQGTGSVWGYIRPDSTAAPGAVTMAYNSGANATRTIGKRWLIEGVTLTLSLTGPIFDPASDGFSALAQPLAELAFVRCAINGASTASTSKVTARLGVVWYENNTFTNGLQMGAEGTRCHVIYSVGNVFTTLAAAYLHKATVAIGNLMSGKDTMIYDLHAPANLPRQMFGAVVSNSITGTTAAANLVQILVTAAPSLGSAYSGNLVVPLATSATAVKIGADASTVDATNVLIFDNTTVAARLNAGYNDFTPALRSRWHYRNNITQDSNVISDYNNHSGDPKGQGDYQNYWYVYRVAHADSVSFNGAGAGGTVFDPATGSGARAGVNVSWAAIQTPATQALQFVNDISQNVAVPSGVADYHPAAGALALNRSTRQTRKYDLLGATKRTDGTGAVGAIERTI